MTTGWVIVIVPNGLLTPVTPPVVVGDTTGEPFATPDTAEAMARSYGPGAYVSQVRALGTV